MNRLCLRKLLYISAAFLLLLGLSPVMMGCETKSEKTAAGGACEQSSECVDGLECRAKKCREPLKNSAPVAKITVDPDKGVKVGEKVLVLGEQSSDPDQDLLTYKWTLKAPEKSQVKLDSELGKRNAFIPDVAGDYVIGLVVNDGREDSKPTSYTVKVEDAENTSPIANAGPDQEVLPASKVTLDGTNSSDADGDKLNYLWTLKGKPDGSNASLDKPEFDKPTFTADLPGDYVISLVVTDERNAKSSEDTVTVRAIIGLDKTPKITKIDPTKSIAQSTFDLTVDGEDFVDGATILIGSKSFAATYKSDKQLTAKIDLAGVTPGDNDLKVVNPNRKESNAIKFNVEPIPVPELTKVEPAIAPIDAKLTVTITGTNFLSSSEVYFGTTPLKTTFVSDKEIKADLNLKGSPTGTYKLSVKSPGGVNSKNELDFQIIEKGPPPVLKVLNPPEGKTGEKVAFSVHGTGFEVGAVIVFDGKDIPTKRIRRDELQADPTLDLTNIPAGDYDVWVRNIDGQVTTKEKFRVEGTDPTPKLDRILPFIIYIDENSTLSVFGQSFSPKIKLFINNVSIPVNPNRLTTNFFEATFNGTSANWKPGDYDAYVENPGGKKSNTFKVTVTYPTPSIDAITPGGWNPGCDVDITITGRNFTSSSLVNFGTTQFTQTATDPKFKLTRNGSTELKFKVLKANLSITTYNVNVVNGPSAKSTDTKFPILNTTGTPVINTVRPAAGAADSQVGITVSYSGTSGRFLPGAYVEVNGKQMPTSCRLSFDNSYCYDLAAKLDLSGIKPGKVDLYVVNPCGKKSAPRSFIVTEAPVPYIKTLLPAYGTVGQKSLISITGKDFAKAHKLYIDGKVVPSVYKSDTEIITASTYDFTNATAGSALDIYVLHDNGKKSSTVKYSVLATGHAPTIEKLSADEFRVGQSHSNVEVVGTGFTTNSELYMGTKKLTVSYGGPTKLTISSLNLSNDPGGVYNLQVKDGTKVSNYYPLFARLPDAPVLDYTSPGSREYGYGTSTYLYIYGSNMCPTSGTSTLCTTNPTIKVEGPGKKDYSGNYSASTRRSTYIYGTLTLTGLPVGDFLFTLGFGSVVSNPAVFSLTPPPPPTITGDNAPYRGDTRTVQLKGTNFATGDEVVVNNNVFGKKPTRNVSKTSLDFDLDLSNAYAGKIDIYVQRCDPTSTNCSKVIKSNTWQLTVNEIPSCTLASNCTAGVSANEGCTSYKGAQTCRPKCTTDAQCKAMLAAPTTATCTGGFCK